MVAEPGVESSDPVFLGQPESTEWFLAQRARGGTRWENRVLLCGFPGGPVHFDPVVCLPYLDAPLLMVVASEDRLAPTELALAAFERAREPKRLELVAGDHFAPYAGEGFAQASQAMRAFLLEQLG